MARKLKLFPDREGKRVMDLGQEIIDRERWARPLRTCRFVVERIASRVEASKKLYKKKFFRGDCHSHTMHSDGSGTVAESKEMADAAGLDFQYVTDHWGITQGPECKKEGLWLGQEPGHQIHHLGVLGLDRCFVPTEDLDADMATIRKEGGTPFLPHPAGWFPKVVYKREWKDEVYKLKAPFLMEIINGANNVVTAFDYTDQMAVDLWDELLMAGRVVHAMGNTDAHIPHAIGIVWNGVFASKCDQPSITKAMQKGKLFVSEAALVDLSVGRVGQGSRVKDRANAAEANVVAVDSEGLLRVRVIGDGKIRKTWHLDGDVEMRETFKIAKGIKKYIRVEVISMDGRRAFSNPVYLA